MRTVDLYQLEVGDIFIEDCYPEHWEVIEITSREGYPGNPTIVAKCVETKEVCDWWYSPQWHGPTLIKV